MKGSAGGPGLTGRGGAGHQPPPSASPALITSQTDHRPCSQARALPPRTWRLSWGALSPPAAGPRPLGGPAWCSLNSGFEAEAIRPAARSPRQTRAPLLADAQDARPTETRAPQRAPERQVPRPQSHGASEAAAPSAGPARPADARPAHSQQGPTHAHVGPPHSPGTWNRVRLSSSTVFGGAMTAEQLRSGHSAHESRGGRAGRMPAHTLAPGTATSRALTQVEGQRRVSQVTPHKVPQVPHCGGRGQLRPAAPQWVPPLPLTCPASPVSLGRKKPCRM